MSTDLNLDSAIDLDGNDQYAPGTMPSTKALESKLARLSAKTDASRTERDEVMRELRAQGVSLRALAELSGISHTAVANITRSATNHPKAPTAKAPAKAAAPKPKAKAPAKPRATKPK